MKVPLQVNHFSNDCFQIPLWSVSTFEGDSQGQLRDRALLNRMLSELETSLIGAEKALALLPGSETISTAISRIIRSIGIQKHDKGKIHAIFFDTILYLTYKSQNLLQFSWLTLERAWVNFRELSKSYRAKSLLQHFRPSKPFPYTFHASVKCMNCVRIPPVMSVRWSTLYRIWYLLQIASRWAQYHTYVIDEGQWRMTS
jgi:hypothetical protein